MFEIFCEQRYSKRIFKEVKKNSVNLTLGSTHSSCSKCISLLYFFYISFVALLPFALTKHNSFDRLHESNLGNVMVSSHNSIK